VQRHDESVVSEALRVQQEKKAFDLAREATTKRNIAQA
jgi:hypothetical protein